MAATWLSTIRPTVEEVYVLFDPEYSSVECNHIFEDYPYAEKSPEYADHGPLTGFWNFLRRAVTPGW